MNQNFQKQFSDKVSELTIAPRRLSGKVRAMASKSVTHRQFICSALCHQPGETAVRMPESLSRDMQMTLDCLHELGASSKYADGAWRIGPLADVQSGRSHHIQCGESGTTLRLLLPVLSALGCRAELTGTGRLPERPLGELCRVLTEHGVILSSDYLPLTCDGQLTAGLFSLPGNVSSQYISGLLLALPLLDGDSELHLTTALESAPYVELTLSVMRRFGVKVESAEWGWRIAGGQLYIRPDDGLDGDGDWSNAAAFLAAGALGGPVTVTGLNLHSAQGDRKILEILRNFGAGVSVSDDTVTVCGGHLRGCDVDLREIPDLLPVLAVVAAASEGTVRFLNGARLRLKECDRLNGVSRMIQALGGRCREFQDSLEIEGMPSLPGGCVDVCNDHRLVMAASLAAQLCQKPVCFSGAAAIQKSYPDFFSDFQQLGGCADGI